MMAQKSFNNFDKVAKAIKPATKLVVRKTAFDAEATIKANITANNQVDTGFMRGSVYVVTSDTSTYGQGPPAPKGATLLPEVQHPTSDTEAYVAVGASYAIHQEYGTAHMPGRPFFRPGIERARAGMDKAMELIKKAMEDAAR